MSERDDDFLSRWSRRKAESRKGLKKKESGAEAEPGAPPAGSEAPEQSARATPGDAPVREETHTPEESPTEAEETTESGFEDVDFEKLNYSSDYTRFMQKGVPDAVRRRALRMLWQSNPVLANIDGLNDYDEDFTDAAMVVKEFATNYKVGSGYLTEEERLASYHDGGETAGEGEETPAEAEAGEDAGDAGEASRTQTRTAAAETDEGETDSPQDDDTV